MNIDKLAFSMAIEDRRYELVRREKKSPGVLLTQAITTR